MALDTLELAEVIDLVKAEILEKYPEANVADFTDWALEAEVLARLFVGNQQQALHALRSRFARTCPDSELDNLAAAYGSPRRGASKHAGHVIALSTDAGVVEDIPVGLVARASDGTEYVVTAAASTARTTFSPSLTAAEGTSRSRIVVAPGVSQLSEGEVFHAQGDFGSDDSWHAVRDLLTTSAAIDVWPETRVTLPVGASLTAVFGCVVAIEAVEEGADSLRGAWTRLTWDPDTKPSDLDDEAIVLLLSGGGDVETNDELRARLVALESGARGVGTLSDYVRWAMNTPNVRVDKAFSFPNYVFRGVMTVVALGVEGARELGPDALARIADYIATQMPASGVSLDVRSALYTTEVDVDVLITPRVGSEPDWTRGSNPSRFEIAAGSTTTVVQLTEDPTSIIRVGDRVLVTTTVESRQRIVQRTVTATTSASITLDTALESAPTTGAFIYSGGPIAQDVIDALYTLFDGLGPGVFSGSVEVVRFPATTSVSSGTLRNGRAVASLMAVEGVEDAEVSLDGVSGGDVVSTVLTVPRPGTITIDWEV